MNWIKVFRAGKYPQGEFSEESLDKIVKNFSDVRSEAALTIDHKQDGPAYGWVKGLKRVGNELLASFDNITEEMKDWVAKKMYRYPSIEVWKGKPEGPILKAITLLGAASPQVSGLGGVEVFSVASLSTIAKVGDQEFICYRASGIDIPSFDNQDMPLFEEFKVADKQLEPAKMTDQVITFDAQPDSNPFVRFDYQHHLEQSYTVDQLQAKLAEAEKKIKEVEAEKIAALTKISEEEIVSFLEDSVHGKKLLPKLAGSARLKKFMLGLNREQLSDLEWFVLSLHPHQLDDAELSKSTYLNFKIVTRSDSIDDIDKEVEARMHKEGVYDKKRYAEFFDKIMSERKVAMQEVS